MINLIDLVLKQSNRFFPGPRTLDAVINGQKTRQWRTEPIMGPKSSLPFLAASFEAP
jgi:hypothetical protein